MRRKHTRRQRCLINTMKERGVSVRAYEFMIEDHGVSPSQRMTLRHLHQIRKKAAKDQREEQERNVIRSIMYSDNAWKLEALEISRLELELAELRANINKTETETIETASKSAIALHSSAKRGIKSAAKQKQKFDKTIKSALGRDLKP